MQIYNFADRLFMIIETEDDFSFKKKNKRDSQNPFVIKWEEIMSKFQKRISLLEQYGNELSAYFYWRAFEKLCIDPSEINLNQNYERKT